MTAWWSIEVFHGEFPARRWQDTYSSALIESALSHGATEWEWHEHRWGVVFEVEFGTDAEWEAFRTLPMVQAALDAVPDPVNGLLVYRGRGGGAGSVAPRRPRPSAGAGAISLPEPGDEQVVHVTGMAPPGLPEPAHAGVLSAASPAATGPARCFRRRG
jgi:hypothetical protein